MIPYIWSEIPEDQKKALLDGVESASGLHQRPRLELEVFREGRSISGVSAPGSYHVSLGLGPSLSLGDYRSSQDPETPIVVRMSRYPCSPGLSRREQHRVGRQELLSTDFETCERKIRDQLGRTLGSYGFDPASDVLAITVNRWPHGYAYAYNTLYDPEEWALHIVAFEARDPRQAASRDGSPSRTRTPPRARTPTRPLTRPIGR